MDVDFATTPKLEGAEMSASEQVCRDFAREFDTPNVKRAIALCEDGTLRWTDVEVIFASSLRKGLGEVA